MLLDSLQHLSVRCKRRAVAHHAAGQDSALRADCAAVAPGAVVEAGARSADSSSHLAIRRMFAQIERLTDRLSRLEQSREVSPPSTGRRAVVAQHAVSARRSPRARSQIAPHYLPHIYSSASSAKAYFTQFFASRGLSGEHVANDSCRLASCIDDAVFVDRTDVFRSAAVERFARRLYALDVVLHDFSPEEELTPLKLELIELYELSLWGDETCHIPAVNREALRRLRRSRRLTRLLAAAAPT